MASHLNWDRVRRDKRLRQQDPIPHPKRNPAPSRHPEVVRRLRSLGYEDFRAYYRSSYWRQFRRDYVASSRPQKCICGSTDVLLHHITYERIGEERLRDVHPLCRACHSMLHVLIRRGVIDADTDPRFLRSGTPAPMEAPPQEAERTVLQTDFDFKQLPLSKQRVHFGLPPHRWTRGRKRYSNAAEPASPEDMHRRTFDP
jgi:hypothetical protein